MFKKRLIVCFNILPKTEIYLLKFPLMQIEAFFKIKTTTTKVVSSIVIMNQSLLFFKYYHAKTMTQPKIEPKKKE